MCRPYVALALATGSFLTAAKPTAAQLWFFPDYALPSFGGDTVEPWIAGTYGRGLDDASGQTNALGILVGVATPRAAVAGGVAHVTEGGGEATVGLTAGVNLLAPGRSRLSLQAGMAYISFDEISVPFSAQRFPIGLAVARTLGQEDSTIEVWVMPRFTLVGTSETTGATTEWGTSAGVWLLNSSGVGLHAAFDGRFAEGATQWRFGLGFHWTGTGILNALGMQ